MLVSRHDEKVEWDNEGSCCSSLRKIIASAWLNLSWFVAKSPVVGQGPLWVSVASLSGRRVRHGIENSKLAQLCLVPSYLCSDGLDSNTF